MDVIEITDKNLDFLKGQPIAKVLYMNTDREYLNQIEEDLKDITQNSNVTYSSNRYIEFNDKGVNKGAGITFLADHLGLDISQTIARSEEHTSELQSRGHLVCRLLLEKKNKTNIYID